MDYKHGGGNALANKKKTTGYSGQGKIDYSLGGTGEANSNSKGTEGYKKTTKADTSKKGKFFSKGSGINFGGISQYGGSNNNENPFQIN